MIITPTITGIIGNVFLAQPFQFHSSCHLSSVLSSQSVSSFPSVKYCSRLIFISDNHLGFFCHHLLSLDSPVIILSIEAVAPDSTFPTKISLISILPPSNFVFTLYNLIFPISYTGCITTLTFAADFTVFHSVQIRWIQIFASCLTGTEIFDVLSNCVPLVHTS